MKSNLKTVVVNDDSWAYPTTHREVVQYLKPKSMQRSFAVVLASESKGDRGFHVLCGNAALFQKLSNSKEKEMTEKERKAAQRHMILTRNSSSTRPEFEVSKKTTGGEK